MSTTIAPCTTWHEVWYQASRDATNVQKVYIPVVLSAEQRVVHAVFRRLMLLPANLKI